jgi:hypothetical protein
MKILPFLIICLLSVSCVSFNPSFGIMAFGQTAKETYETLDGVMTIESFVVIPIGSEISSYMIWG